VNAIAPASAAARPSSISRRNRNVNSPNANNFKNAATINAAFVDST
jgi:hypothetical protein